MSKKIVLIGGGGHAGVVIDAIATSGEFEIFGIIDPGIAAGVSIKGISVLGNDDILKEVYASGVRNAFITKGSIGDPGIRIKLYELARAIGYGFPFIMHPKANVSADARIGEGSFIAASATVVTGTVVGRNAIINTSASVDHDSVIADFVHVSPGAILCGGVNVGARTHIGAGAIIVQNVKIGTDCFINAGAIVSKNVADNEKVR
ncbi:MAG: NeuD/PglB/VioB family sugar acetyltransferase [Candidatus Omnitrophica bacterium]|nr:NeuD/PglB/VioB family sugar acetyltransferase [Candidatus Omnitrophota bacterium]